MGHNSIARDLLAAGASASYPIPSVNGATALFGAAQRGHTEVFWNQGVSQRFSSFLLPVKVVKILAGEVTNVDQATTDSNVTPLLVAAEMGFTPVVSMLISFGANVDWSSREVRFFDTSIHEAVFRPLFSKGLHPSVPGLYTWPF